jgi:hypothetical protein
MSTPSPQEILMQFRADSACALLAALVFCASCSSGGDSTNPSNNNNNNANGTSSFSAKIDGVSWSASTATGSVTALQFAPQSGGYIIGGIGTGAAASLLITLNYITGPGVYPLGVDAVSVQGGFAGVTVGSGGTWTTPISGAAGSITVTRLTTTSVAGTFNFTATGSGGGATGSKVVTEGQFVAPLNNAPIATLTDSMGGRMGASLNGQSWNAGIVSGQMGPVYLSLSGINNLQTLLITIPRPSGPGTYAMSNAGANILLAWDPNAVAPAGARCCYGTSTDVGTITFTSVSNTRAKGTFSATLHAQPGTAATGTLVITNGTFDIGLFHN